MDVSSDMQLRIAETIAYVSSRIRELRIGRGMTVLQLADRCGMDRPNLSRIEAGRTNPTLRTLCTICYALDVELTDLLPERRTDPSSEANEKLKIRIIDDRIDAKRPYPIACSGTGSFRDGRCRYGESSGVSRNTFSGLLRNDPGCHRRDGVQTLEDSTPDASHQRTYLQTLTGDSPHPIMGNGISQIVKK